MDILALVEAIGLNGVTSAALQYAGIASDGVTTAAWGGTITIDLSQTSNQITATALAQVKADAAVQMGKVVPGNARIKVLGV